MKKITLEENQLRDIMRLCYSEGFYSSVIGISEENISKEELDSKGLKTLGDEHFEKSYGVTMLPKLMDKAGF